MKVPRTVELKGKKWKIISVERLEDEDGDPAMGLTDRNLRVIELDSTLSKKEKSLTFWHEVTHGALHEAHITEVPGGLSEILEHVVCEAVAEAVVSIIGEFE